MKSIAALLAISILLAGGDCAQAVAPASDAAPPTDVSPHTRGKSESERSADAQRHIADLHAKLGINPAEESLWSAVATTMADNAKQLERVMEEREAASASAIDDLNAYAAVVQTHADGVRKLSTAFASLYASMSDDQKRTADKVFAQHGREAKHEPRAMK